MRKLIIAGMAGFIGFGMGVSLPVIANESDHGDVFQRIELLAEVLETVRSQYVEEVDDRDLIEAALRGIATSLDPHSAYESPDRYSDTRDDMKGEFGGLGIQVSMEQGLVKVISPIDDTPAAKAGLQPGDFITHIDGDEVEGKTLTDAVGKMRGPVGTEIELTIYREGQEPFDVTLVRAIIPLKSARSRAEGEFGYLRLTKFDEQTTRGLRTELKKLEEEIDGGFKGLVLDLRNNPGGVLNEAITVSDAFLERGEIVSTIPRDKGQTRRFDARKGDLIDGKPIVVLINGGSASASEIVAGALQDHKRAVIMGTQSYGKGSVQTIIPLEALQGAALRLTTARYYTPSGRSIHTIGIEPDEIVEIPETTEGNTDISDYQLEKALEKLRELTKNG